ncbi:MAG TPA: hypothetical protein VES02_17620 [Dermatophilaceae bacterium]|nr:hypothetical protein [Dermatophilaceae bacterium]
MSHSEMPGNGEGAHSVVPADERIPTGDAAVDDVLGHLDTVTGESLDSQIEAGEEVHRVLQDRLADLGQE